MAGINKMAGKKSASTVMASKVGRTSFMDVFESVDNYNKDGKVYQVTMLFPKSESMDWLQDKWDEVSKDCWPNGEKDGTFKRLRPLFSAGDPFDDKGAVIDGDWKYGNNVKEDKKSLYESYRGNWLVSFKVKDDGQPWNPVPQVVGEDKSPLAPTDFVSGNNAIVVFELSAFEANGRPIMGALKLRVIQRQPGGEPFSTGVSTSAAMDLLDGGTDNMMDLL